MKLRFISAVLACVAMFGYANASTFVNLTPKPKEMTVGTGELALPATLTIGHATLSEPMQAEIGKFISTFSAATGITVSEGTTGLINVAVNADLHEEGYKLTVTTDGVNIEAATDAGLYYAFQSLMKMMPANVILGKFADDTYALPVVTINDEPRYHWRGMEIDVARHFFDVDEIKKMLDIMAVYKMNRLHWHLTDDQGWRIEMPKYPKLTTEAATPQNAYWWDFDNHKSFLTNEMYGPHFYTVEQMKEVVAYAKERHIEVCPEVDLPGHMQCAIAAYPEFSTTPDGEHPVRYWPGVSTDVLDISNPAVVQFLKDVIDQLTEIFPYEYIHIGGDECPTTAWANSASCQAFKQEYGLQSDRALQNWLVKELASHAKKDNRRLICWNEIITTEGADTKLAQDADILIYAWLGAGTANNPSKLAASLGLRSVWCSTSHYYIDYPQWNGPDEPKSMGYALTLETVYNAVPDYDEAKKEFYYGVNCNLWTEYICENKHLEYNALPRMIAVAEAGWTPQALKNFTDFKTRFNADTQLLDLGNYTYGRHYVDANAEALMPEQGKFYRLITQASHDANRKDRCIELVHDGCSLIADKGATVGRLWTNIQAAKGSADYDWQYWTFEADPEGSGKYAMVNRNAPEGSVNPAMSGSSVSASWNYDNSAKHYNFVLGEQNSTADLGSILTIRSDKGSDWYLNCAQAGQNQTVNNWNNPVDGNGGMWLFHLEDYTPTAENVGNPFTPLTSGSYAFVNTLGRGPLSQTDGEMTTEPNPAFGAIGWTVTAGAYDEATNAQTLTLQNMATGLYVSGVSETAKETTTGIGFADVYANNGGYDVLFTADAASAAAVTLTKATTDADEYFLTVDGKRLFAFGPNSIIEVNGVNANENSPAIQGSAWTIKAIANAVKATAVEGDETIGTFYHYDLEGETPANPLAIPYELYEYVSQTEGDDADGHRQVTVTVKRIKREVTYRLVDTNGVNWEVVTDTIGADETFVPAAPARRYLTFERMGEVVADTATVIYTTEAIPGIGKLGKEVTAVADGGIYAIEDAHVDRHAFRGAKESIVGGSRTAEGCSPAYMWTLEADGSNFNVKNMGNGLYMQAVKRSVAATLDETPYAFTFTYNAEGYWTVKNSRSSLCWDGNEDLTLVGWDAPGHPYKFYTVAEAAPFYTITVTERTDDGTVFSTRRALVKAGASYLFAANSRPGKALVSIEGNEELEEIYANKNIIVTYHPDEDAINEIAADQTPGIKGIYDLSGRRLSKVGRPGVYIINGVKTLVK